jgi:hypothetical protein
MNGVAANNAAALRMKGINDAGFTHASVTGLMPA